MEAGRAGVKAEFVDACFSVTELESWKLSRAKAPKHKQIPQEHLAFLHEIVEVDGWPKFRGHNAGLGAIFKLHRD